jgi:hypothetical protein
MPLDKVRFRNLFLWCLFFVVFSAQIFSQVKLAPQKISLKNGKTFSLHLPAGYEIIPAAEGLKRVRFFAKATDGRIFVTDLHDLTDNKRGTVYILGELDAQTGKFGKVVPYLTNLKNPNSVQFYTDTGGQDWIYLAETDKLTRRRFTRGETKPGDSKPQTLAVFPDYGLDYKYGGWHLKKTVNRLRSCRNVPRSYSYFPAHSSALGFDYFGAETADALIKNSFLVALHGSTDKDLAKGYRIVIVRKGERSKDLISGFLQGKRVVGRPCDIMKLDESSFLFTDDYSGVIYLVRRKN